MEHKTFKTATVLGIVTFALCTNTACSNDDDAAATIEGPVAAQVSAGIGESLTRAVGTKWSNSDNIGVRVTDASSNSDMTTRYKNVQYKISTLTNDNTTAEFKAAVDTKVSTMIFFQAKDETATFAAYAPYQSSNPNALPGTSSDGKITVETSANNGSSTQETIDFIYASGATASHSNHTVQFTGDHAFAHKMSRMKLTFKAGKGFNASDILSGFTFTLGGLNHNGTFDVTTGTAATTGTEKKASWDITNCNYTDDDTSANTRTYTLILLPQDLSSSALTLTATSNGQPYENSTLIKPNMKAGKSYSYTITVNKTGLTISGCTITDWTDGNGNDGESGNAEMP